MGCAKKSCKKCTQCSKAMTLLVRLSHNKTLERKVFTRNGNVPNYIHGKDRHNGVIVVGTRNAPA